MRTQIYIVSKTTLFEIESFPLLTKGIGIDSSVLNSAKVLHGKPIGNIDSSFDVQNICICKDENGFYQYIWVF
jgi:hypothetical protein